MNTKIEFTRINNDINGNPRFVCHYSNLMASNYTPDGVWIPIDEAYNIALKKAKQIGGRKFHNKQYGGGIVFQSYNIAETEKAILALL